MVINYDMRDNESKRDEVLQMVLAGSLNIIYSALGNRVYLLRKSSF